MFAGLELRRSRAQDLRQRRAETEGVAVSWVPNEVPRTAQNDQGRASWVYEFTAYNPGPLPVSDVRAEVLFTVNVQRVHYDGHLDDPVDRLVLVTLVIAGGGDRTWRRRLLLDYAEAEEGLPRTRAVISFENPEDLGRRQENSWPKRPRAADARNAIPPPAAYGNSGS